MPEITAQVGLSAEQLNALFPFHFVVNREFRFVQLGSSINVKFDTKIVLGAYMDNFFEITTPVSLLNWGYLRSMSNEICSLRHKSTQIDFSARILPAGNDKMLFVLKPLMNTTSYLDQFGLDVTDFSNHDIINDLFQHRQHGHSRPKIDLSNALTSQEVQLNEIRRLLANQEAESRKLAHIISRSTYWIIIANTKGAIEWANEAFLQNTGRQLDDVLGKSFNELLDTAVVSFDDLRQHLQAKLALQKEIQLNANGEQRWIDIDIRALCDDHGEALNFIAIGRDITEQKKTQLLNERLSTELNTIFDLSPDGFVSFDENGRLGQVNQAFLEMTGLQRDALEKISANDFEELLASVDEYDHGPGDLNANIIKTRNPKPTIIRRSVKAVADSSNKNQKTIHYFQNITHEYELSRMKGEFLSAAAHELRTPMASIFGFTNLLINRSYTQEQMQVILQNMYRQATRMSKLINDLLNLARIEAKGKLEFKPVPVAIDELVLGAINEFKGEAAERTIKVGEINAGVTVLGDADKLTQVLVNLLSNAHKYSEAIQEVQIEILEKSFDDRPMIGLCVIDHGTGISKPDQAKLFEPFFRASSTMKVPGTGLGMSIIKQIIDVHNGQIEVESEVGVGTRITAWIPKAISKST